MSKNLENFPISSSAKRMLSYVSAGFYDTSYVGKWLYQVMGLEYDMALEIVEDLLYQFFPETATWGLMYHEIKWGLPIRENLTYEERRRLIYQKRDFRAPMTPYRMEKYLEDATGFTVIIADVNDPGSQGFDASHPNIFKVYFMGEGALDTSQIYRTLNKLKQSDTMYEVDIFVKVCELLYIGSAAIYGVKTHTITDVIADTIAAGHEYNVGIAIKSISRNIIKEEI